MREAYPMDESWMVDGKWLQVGMYAQGDASFYIGSRSTRTGMLGMVVLICRYVVLHLLIYTDTCWILRLS